MRTMWKLAAGAALCLAMTIAPAEAAATCNNVPTALCNYDSPNDNSIPVGFYWTQTVVNVPIEHETTFCPEHLCNVISARISNRKPPGWSPWADPPCNAEGPVVLFMTGDGETHYMSETEIDPDDNDYAGECQPGVNCDDPPEGLRLLQQKLWDAGARILEIRYRCPMLDPHVVFYDNTHACQHTLLTSVLKMLNQQDITEHPPGLPPVPTSEPWWPDAGACRFAYGDSEGETQLMFAIDVMTNNDDGGIGVMNRVVHGGGGLPYDVRGNVDCNDTGDDLLTGCALETNDACKHLEFTDFLFGDLAEDVVDACGGCWEGCIENPPSCPNNQSCAATPESPIQLGLNEGSIKSYIGTSEDQDRLLGAVIVSTGEDEGLNEQANLAYLGRRDSHSGDDINEATWHWPHCLCLCPFWGHGGLNLIYAMFKGAQLPEGKTPIDDWTEFFVGGDLVWNLYPDVMDDFPDLCEGINPDCQTVAPPEAAAHADRTCTPP